MDIDKEIKTTEVELKKTVEKVLITDDTYLNRSLLNLASRQNDLIFTLQQKQKYKGGSH